LALCLALVDLNVPQQESDRQLLEFLDSAARLFLVVGTKADKLSGNALRKSLDAFRDVAPAVRVVPFSARTGLGRDELWQEIRAACQGEVNLPRQAAL
jgi:GTP-binding protein